MSFLPIRGFHLTAVQLTAVQQSNYSPLRTVIGCNRPLWLPPALANFFRLCEILGSNPCLSAIFSIT